jgi:hypothetical protein
MLCISKSTLFVPDHSTGASREVEQRISLSSFRANVIGFADLSTVTKEQIDEICQKIIFKTESLQESVRKRIREEFNKDFRDTCSQWIDKVYGKQGKKDFQDWLKNLHWRLLFSAAQNGEQISNTIQDHFQANIPRYFDLSSAGNPQAEIVFWDDDPVELVARYEQEKREKERREREEKEDKERAEANAKAEALMKRVCGEELFRQYKETGKIVVENQYGWKLEAGDFYLATVISPKGNRAQVCIHTYGLSCHPIDEMILKYLYFMSRFDEFVANSNVMKESKNFELSAFLAFAKKPGKVAKPRARRQRV